MRCRAADADRLLSRVDPGRLFGGRAVGLRDGAVLALLAAGLTTAEISTLRASAVTMNEGQVQLAIQRRGITWSATLPTALGARLLAWLSESRLWGEEVPLFTSRRGGPLSHAGISGVLHRYRHHPPRPARKRIKRRKRKVSVATVARISGARRGRPVAAVNPLELVTFWEGRGGRRPLSQREIARKLGVSQATARKRLRELREAGEVDDQARARALAARGGLRRGGRPATPLVDADLAVAWALQLQTARRRGRVPSIAAIARTLHVSRSRVRSRLQELGLLSQQEDAPASTRSLINPTTALEIPAHE